MSYRDELDALNALVEEQRKTNALLERMLQTQADEKDGESSAAQRRGRRNSGKTAE